MFVLLLAAACSLEPLPAPAHSGAVVVGPPWDTMELPLSLGTVTRSDGLGLVVRMDAPQGSPVLVDPWAQALTRQGWAQVSELTPPAADGRPAFAQRLYAREAQQIALQVRQQGGVAVCSLARLP